MPSAAITISPIDVYAPYARDLGVLMRAYAAASRSAGGGRGGAGAGGVKVTGTGEVTDPNTGETTSVALHGTKDERKAELESLQNKLVRDAIAQRAASLDISGLGNMSVEKSEKTLQQMQQSLVNDVTANAPQLRSSATNYVSSALAPLREEVARRKQEVTEASTWDVLGRSLRSAGSYINQMVTLDAQKQAQLARERQQQEALDRQANAYLENQYRRAQEGEGPVDRMGGTGRVLANLLSGGLEMAAPLGATVGAAGIGSFFGPAGTAGGAGAVGAVTGRVDLYNRIAAEHPDWTPEQIVEAASEGVGTAMTAGAVTNAALYQAGRILPFLRGARTAEVPAGTNFAKGLQARVAAGREAADEAAARFAARSRMGRLLPNVRRGIMDVAPMAAAYQVGQNLAYDEAMGRESTWDTLTQGVPETAMGAAAFGTALGLGRTARGAKALPERYKVAETTGDEGSKSVDPIELAKKVARPEAPVLDEATRKSTVDSTMDLLKNETDIGEAKLRITALQDLNVPLSEIKKQLDASTTATNDIKDFVNGLVEAEKLVVHPEDGKAVRKEVAKVLQEIHKLQTLDTNGKPTGFTPEAVAKAVELLDNLPQGATNNYINAVLGELAKAKNRNKLFKEFWQSKNKNLNYDSTSATNFASFVKAIREARAGRAVETVNQAKGLRTAVDELKGAQDAGQDVVTNGPEGKTAANIADSATDSQLGTDTTAIPPATPDGSVAKALGDTPPAQERGAGGTPEQNNGAVTPPARSVETGEVISRQGTDGGPSPEPTAPRPTAEGEGTGVPPTEAGGRTGGDGDATGAGKPADAGSGDAGKSVAEQVRSVLKRGNLTGKEFEGRSREEIYAGLKQVADNPEGLTKKQVKAVNDLVKGYEKKYPELKASVMNSPEPVGPTVTVSPEASAMAANLVMRMPTTSPQAVTSYTKTLLGTTDPTTAFHALDGIRTSEDTTPAVRNKVEALMANIHRKNPDIQKTADQIQLLDRICKN